MQIRYKCYYFDQDTNLFYVTSRYYSPELGRFIQPANVSSLNPNSINGLNLYSYAYNNPVANAASSSDNFSTTSNYMLLGSDSFRVKAYTSNKKKRGFVGFYKGVPTFRFENDYIASFSFGFVFINNKYEKENTLEHEWGHTRQMMMLGVGDFFNMIAIPSLITNLIDRDNEVDYYNMPWEITADMFGGVTREEHNELTRAVGAAYLKSATFISNFIVKPLMLPVYTTAAALIDSIIPGIGTILLTIMYGS